VQGGARESGRRPPSSTDPLQGLQATARGDRWGVRREIFPCPPRESEAIGKKPRRGARLRRNAVLPHAVIVVAPLPGRASVRGSGPSRTVVRSLRRLE